MMESSCSRTARLEHTGPLSYTRNDSSPSLKMQKNVYLNHTAGWVQIRDTRIPPDGCHVLRVWSIYIIPDPFFHQLVLWCSWLSLLSNTQAVPGSNPGGIIAFATFYIVFGPWLECVLLGGWMKFWAFWWQVRSWRDHDAAMWLACRTSCACPPCLKSPHWHWLSRRTD